MKDTFDSAAAPPKNNDRCINIYNVFSLSFWLANTTRRGVAFSRLEKMSKI